MKKILTLVLVCFASLLIGCTSDGGGGTTTHEESTLVVYFSATGTTERIANMITEYTNATEYEIIPAEPYSSADLNYNDSTSRSSIENRDDSIRPEIANLLESIDEYEVIYLGYPIWWGKAPKVVYTFLENYDFTGKTIIPFATSGSTGIGSSERLLQNLVPEATWLAGSRFASSTRSQTVHSWIDELEY